LIDGIESQSIQFFLPVFASQFVGRKGAVILEYDSTIDNLEFNGSAASSKGYCIVMLTVDEAVMLAFVESVAVTVKT
jgi:hypothetical protein